MTRARLRLIRDPETGDHHAWMGLFASTSTFALLGQGTVVHMRILAFSFCLVVLCLVFTLPLAMTMQNPDRQRARLRCPPRPRGR
jgi:hypothetical protein